MQIRLGHRDCQCSDPRRGLARHRENRSVGSRRRPTSVPMEITVDRPAATVWERVGKYCAVAEWLQVLPDAGSCRARLARWCGSQLWATARCSWPKPSSLTPTLRRRRRHALQYLSRHDRGEAAHGDHVESLLHTEFDNSMLADDPSRDGSGDAPRAFHAGAQEIKILAEGGTLRASSRCEIIDKKKDKENGEGGKPSAMLHFIQANLTARWVHVRTG